MKEIQDLSKEELIALCEKQENELATVRSVYNHYREENEKLKNKLSIIQNITAL